MAFHLIPMPRLASGNVDVIIIASGVVFDWRHKHRKAFCIGEYKRGKPVSLAMDKQKISVTALPKIVSRRRWQKKPIYCEN
jgi:hypothetical protein